MASLPSALVFKTTFDLPDEELVLTDSTDYTGVTGTLVLTFSVLDPTGTLYQSSSTYPTLPAAIPLPLLVSDEPIPGLYEFTFKVANTTALVEMESTIEYDFTYTSPVVDVDMTVDCIYPLLESTDATDYSFGSLAPTTLTRSHVLQYPPSTGQADVTVTTALLQTGTVYTLKDQPLQHSATVTTDLVYDPNANISIIDEVTGTGYIDVQCDNDLCDVYCALKCKWTDYDNQKCLNKTLADKYLTEFIQMTSYARMIESAMKCGKGDDISVFTQEISKLSNCDSCGCSDGDPILITGLGVTIGGGGNIYNVVSGGSPIVVSSATVGSTTTYTVTLASATVAKIASLHNTVVTAGSNVTVTSATAVDGTVTYTVNSTSAVEQDMMSFVLTLDSTTLSAIPTLTVSAVTSTGTYFSGAPTVYWFTTNGISSDTNPSYAQFNSLPVGIFIEDIFSIAPLKSPKIHVDILKAYHNFTPLYNLQDDVFLGITRSVELHASAFYKNQEASIVITDRLSDDTSDNTGKLFTRTVSSISVLSSTIPANKGYYVQLSITMIL